MDVSDCTTLDGSGLRHELSAIKCSIEEVLRYLSDAQTCQESLSSRVAALESQQDARGSSRLSDSICRWICPVCWKPFAHRASFKGHIRRLTESPTDRMHCHLDPDLPEQNRLLAHARYGHGDFPSRLVARFPMQERQTSVGLPRQLLGQHGMLLAAPATCENMRFWLPPEPIHHRKTPSLIVGSAANARHDRGALNSTAPIPSK